MAKYPKEEKERLIDDFKKEDIELLKNWIDKTTELTTNQVLKDFYKYATYFIK